MTEYKNDEIHAQVKARYGRIALDAEATTSASCCDSDGDEACCQAASLYDSDISWLPDEVTGLSLGCGDPLALAELQPGDTVLDLGSGGGIDCFMAARQVGPSGRVLGVDMTPAMIAKANRNKEKVELDNVEFRLGQIENLPVDSNTVDVVISNCVINLSPDKPAVFKEIYRVLKAGGRVALSDIVTLGQFTAAQRADMDAWAACVSGAEEVAVYAAVLKAAGFINISIRDKGNPAVELASAIGLPGPAKWFSARVTAEKPSY